jgi:hypothetical protein
MINELFLLYPIVATLSFIDISLTFFLFDLTKKHNMEISETNFIINLIRKYINKPFDYILTIIFTQILLSILYKFIGDIRIFYILLGVLLIVNIIHFSSIKLIDKTIKMINKKQIKNYNDIQKEVLKNE